MDLSYVNGMRLEATLRDMQRGVKVSRYRPTETAPDDTPVGPISWHVLTLWREAGSPLPWVCHLGPFFAVEAL